VKRLPQNDRKSVITFYVPRSFDKTDDREAFKSLGEKTIEAGAARYIGPYDQRIFLRTLLGLFSPLQ